MLITALEKEKQQIYHNGRVEGKREGRVEGKKEGKIESARGMLAKGMEVELIAEITGLPETQLLQLKVQFSVKEMLYQ